MRRPVPSFTVEVRRRPRLPITSNPGAQPSQSTPRKQHLTERRIVQRPRRSVRTWIVHPLKSRHHIRGVGFFQASSPTNRGIVCSNTRQYPLKTQSHLRERQSDRPCGRQSKRFKHPNRRATRASRLRSMRRRLRDRRPILSERPACNQMEGPALRRVRQVKLSKTAPR